MNRRSCDVGREHTNEGGGESLSERHGKADSFSMIIRKGVGKCGSNEGRTSLQGDFFPCMEVCFQL